MPQFPGFPTNDFDFHFEEAGGALAGLLMRNRSGDVVPGILANTDTLLTAGSGWSIQVSPFVAARSKGRAVLLGGTTEEVLLDVSPAPAANSRIDVIYSLPADVGAGDPPIAVAVATGNPGAVPAKPSIPVGAIELGTFRTQAGQTGAVQAQLVETFPFAALHGATIRVRTRAALSGLDLLTGSTAFIIADGVTVERVGTEWITSKTAVYASPFKAYGTGLPAVEVTVDNGMVMVRGIATTTKQAELVGTTNRLICNIGDKHAPRGQLVQVMQGSGISRWTLTLESDGNMFATRYGPETPGTNVWLPFSLTYPMKR